jgi:hypothetical protein
LKESSIGIGVFRNGKMHASVGISGAMYEMVLSETGRIIKA